MFSLKIQSHAKGNMQKRCRLFHATDFQSLMYPCFTICRILGMFPYKINASTFEISKPLYILSTVIICVCCGFNLLLTYGLIITQTITFEAVTGTLQSFCYFTCSSLIATMTHILSNPRMRLFQTILDISTILSWESHKKLSRLIHTKDIFGVIFLVMQIYLYFSKMAAFEINCLTLLIAAFSTYLDMLVFQMNMLYMNFMCVLKACFKKINDDLIYMQRLMINNMKPLSPSLICHMRRNQFFLFKVKTLMKQHLIISKTVEKLNLIFNLQILSSVIVSFFLITFGLYSYIVRWQGEVQITFDKHLLDAYLASVAYHIINVTLIVWACETGKNQAQEIVTTIYDVLNITRDEQIKGELQLFSLQILHHKNIFSVKGLTVDATLLTAMVGSITTYMLILIQFLIALHSCDGTSVINT